MFINSTLPFKDCFYPSWVNIIKLYVWCAPARFMLKVPYLRHKPTQAETFNSQTICSLMMELLGIIFSIPPWRRWISHFLKSGSIFILPLCTRGEKENLWVELGSNLGPLASLSTALTTWLRLLRVNNRSLTDSPGVSKPAGSLAKFKLVQTISLIRFECQSKPDGNRLLHLSR